MAHNDRRRVHRWREGVISAGPDSLAIEEPLEIDVDGISVSTTMRTPGHDIELALGWLVAEGVITRIEQIAEAKECFEHDCDEPEQVRRMVKVTTRNALTVRPRLHSTSSACGICGADLVDWIQRSRHWLLSEDLNPFNINTILNQPTALRDGQRGFAASGGLHAAGLFTASGEMLCIREDVGRHNAVDKVIGWVLQEGELPLRGHVLQVSGRASAELVHKAVMAGIPLLAAVSAPSTLAVDLARKSGLTLIGFLRSGSFNIYAGAERLRLD